MTSGVRRTSVGEERLVRYLRVCDYLFYWGFGTGVVGIIAWRSVRVLGLGLGRVPHNVVPDAQRRNCAVD